jgi:uncharacterized membrane protein
MATTVLAKPDQTERSAAAGVHVGAIFVPIWVPLIAYVVTRRNRPFVAAHARQSLVETFVLNVFIGIAMLGSLAYTVWRVWSMYQEGFENVDWWAAVWQSLLRIGIWWLVMGILWVINLFVSLRQAGMAYRGEWPKSAVKRAARTAGN